MLYHASPVGGLTELRPHISNHGISLLYFSQKRGNTLVYLSNAVEKYCRETGFDYNGPWKKWGPYGFTEDGRQRIEEYYPHALEETYRGVSGYIYTAERVIRRGPPVQIMDTVTSRGPVAVTPSTRPPAVTRVPSSVMATVEWPVRCFRASTSARVFSGDRLESLVTKPFL